MSVLSLEDIKTLSNHKSDSIIGLPKRQNIVKRALNVIVASFALAMVLPVMITLAMAIKLTSDGPVLSSNDGLYTFNSEAFGDKLSKTNLDQLPQLLNVIKGDINLI